MVLGIAKHLSEVELILNLILCPQYAEVASDQT